MNQSLLTQAEYDKYSKIYGTYCPTCRKSGDQDPPPCWKMGESYSKDEIKIINDRLAEAKKTANIEAIERVWRQIEMHGDI